MLRFRDPEPILSLSKALQQLTIRPLKLMEVCGTHTVCFGRFGLKSLVPNELTLLSGPGCPVCVTPQREIEKALQLSNHEDVILVTFGDMMRVPVGSSSLEKQRALGADVRVVTSPLEAVRIARENAGKKVVFFAVGFETTAPAVARTVLYASDEGLRNFFLLCAHRLVPPAMVALLEGGEVKVNGFMCPGHVSAIIGTRPYEGIATRFSVPCVISGFEPLDMMETLVMLAKMVGEERAEVRNQYRRVVKPEGNPVALRLMEKVFQVVDAEWRGLGVIAKSGLKLADGYAAFDAETSFQLEPYGAETSERDFQTGCRCGDVLRGSLSPEECPLFATACTPSTPFGPCMVSGEGTCAAHFKYGRPNED